MEVLDRASEQVEFIRARHEELARAHARFTGEVDICIGTSGLGAIRAAARAVPESAVGIARSCAACRCQADAPLLRRYFAAALTGS